MRVPVMVDVRITANPVLEADVQVIPETTMQHHVSHHPNPVFNLQVGGTKKHQLCEHTRPMYSESVSVTFNEAHRQL